jgi:hypothetical protein
MAKHSRRRASPSSERDVREKIETVLIEALGKINDTIANSSAESRVKHELLTAIWPIYEVLIKNWKVAAEAARHVPDIEEGFEREWNGDTTQVIKER